MSDDDNSVSPSESAVILCGGLGSRLGDLTRSTPKPLLPVAGRPFIGYLLTELKRFGFRRVVLLAGFASDQIVEFARSSAVHLGLDISTSCEPEPAGTGGALHHALDGLDPTFMLLNGDSWFDFNWLDLAASAAEQPSSAIIVAARKVDDATRYGTLTVRDGRATRFSSRPDRGGPGLVNGGVYYVRRDLLAAHLTAKCSLEGDVLPKLTAEGYVGAKVYEGFFLDIGIPEAFVEAQTTIPARQRRPAVVLSRASVLNGDVGRGGPLAGVGWGDEAVASLKRLNDAGVYVFAVCHRSSVAGGSSSDQDFAPIYETVQKGLRRHGAHIDGIQVCSCETSDRVPLHAQQADGVTSSVGSVTGSIRRWPVGSSRVVSIGGAQTDSEVAFAASGGAIVGDGGLTFEVTEQVLRSIFGPRGCAEISVPPQGVVDAEILCCGPSAGATRSRVDAPSLARRTAAEPAGWQVERAKVAHPASENTRSSRDGA